MKKAFSLILIICFEIIFCQTWSYEDINFEGVLLAEITRYLSEEQRQSNNGELVKVLSYDKCYHIIEDVDRSGLFLRYKYDSIGNILKTYFYENFDRNNKRVLSNKSEYHYMNGLIIKADWYNYNISSGNWEYESSINYDYKFNKNGRIIEGNFFDKNNKLVWTEHSTYNQNKPTGIKYYHNYLTNLILPNVKKQITTSPNNDTLSIKTYKYDNYDNIVKETVFISGKTTINKYKYNKENLQIEESIIIGDRLLFRKETDYDEHNRIKEIRLYNSFFNKEELSEIIVYNYIPNKKAQTN